MFLAEAHPTHPTTLRERVTESIRAYIEPEAWGRCAWAQEAEQTSLEQYLDKWGAA